MPSLHPGTKKRGMRKAAVALLFSGLVFPGLGKLYLKRYLRGLAMMTIATAGLVILIGIASFAAAESLQEIFAKGGALDVRTIVRLAVQSSQSDQFYYKVVFLCVAICWVFSIIDAYLVGKKEEGNAGE